MYDYPHGEEAGERAAEANIALNKELDDSNGHTKKIAASKLEGTATAANQKIAEALEGTEAEAEPNAPTYLYNNTPAIKIDEEE